MRIDDQNRIRKLFEEAMDHPAAERAGFLDTACGGDTELRAEVEALIGAYGRADGDGFLEEPTDSIFERVEPGDASDPHEAATGPAPAEPAAETIGRFHLLDVLGEGGFGTVYRAHQSTPVDRMVALKLIKLGMDTKRVVSRFEAERQALALMDHPGIARVFDGGATEAGRPYFVMELVKGTPITAYCERNKLDVDARLDLFMGVCSAIQHAHQKGIIHRDLKPSNVLVTMQDGKPVPKVIDFGIAKALDRKLTAETIYTEQRQLIGTPQYMSPEQAEMSLDIDTRSDVYTLGVLLYELLTGLTPFDSEKLASAGFGEVQRIIREEEPEKPSTRVSSVTSRVSPPQPSARADVGSALADHVARPTDPRALARTLRGDLDWIVMRCLEKDRTRRYETANALADDIERHLHHEPVEASPPSAAYRFRKFARRHRGALATGVAVALALIVGLGAATAAFVQASRERDAKTAALAESEAITDFLETTLSSVDPAKEGKDVRVHEILDQAAERIDEDFGDYPAIRARLQHIIGSSFVALEMHQDAQPHLLSALEGLELTLGADAPETIDCMWQLQWVCEALREYEQGEALARERHARAVRYYGERHPVTAMSMSDVGMCLTRQEKLTEAEPWLGGSVDLARELAAEEPVVQRPSRSFDEQNVHWVLGQALNNLAIHKGYLGENWDSREFFREALEITRMVEGPDGPNVFHQMGNVSRMSKALRDWEEAERLGQEAVDGLLRVYGRQTDGVMRTRAHLADISRRRGRFEEAIRRYDEPYRWFRDTYGDNHEIVWGIAAKYAECLVRQDETEHLASLVPLVRRGCRGGTYQIRVKSFMVLVLVHLHLDRFEAARDAWFDFAWQVDEGSEQIAFLRETRSLAWTLNDLLTYLEENDRYDTYQAFLSELRPVVESRPFAAVCNVLAWFIVREPREAADEYVIAVDAARRAVEIDSSVDYRNTLGVAQYRVGLFEAALDTLLACDEDREVHSPDDWAFIAMAYHQMGKYDEARAAAEIYERLMEDPEHAADEQYVSFLNEMRALLGP